MRQEDESEAAVATVAGGHVQTQFLYFLKNGNEVFKPYKGEPSVVKNSLSESGAAKPATTATVSPDGPSIEASETPALTLADALALARAHRVSVIFAGGRQVFVGADHPPPADVVVVLRRVGTDLLALVPLVNDPWLFADWRWFFKERADGAEQSGLARAEAQARAFECCVIEWGNRHLVDSPQDRCCWCGGIERADENNPLLPFGVGPHAWVHDRCWKRWRDWRRGEAVAALAALGIRRPRQGGEDDATNDPAI